MDILGSIGKMFSGAGGGIVESIGNVADKFITTKEEKAEFLQKAQDAIRKHEKDLTNMYLADTQNARLMQIEALKQGDKFAKRFIYYLSVFIIGIASAFGLMLFFVEVPEQNQRLVDMFADVFLFASAVTIINFFFGSAQPKESENQSRQIDDILMSRKERLARDERENK